MFSLFYNLKVMPTKYHFFCDFVNIFQWCPRDIKIYTTGKKYGIFFISAIFLYFVGCVRYIFIWFTFLQADITFGELIHTQQQNEPQRFKNNYFGPFSLSAAG